jgi:hypothetical protein
MVNCFVTILQAVTIAVGEIYTQLNALEEQVTEASSSDQLEIPQLNKIREIAQVRFYYLKYSLANSFFFCFVMRLAFLVSGEARRR